MIAPALIVVANIRSQWTADRSHASRIPEYIGTKTTQRNISIAYRPVARPRPLVRSLAADGCISRYSATTTNWRIRKKTNIPVTMRLRTACRNSLTAIGLTRSLRRPMVAANPVTGPALS